MREVEEIRKELAYIFFYFIKRCADAEAVHFSSLRHKYLLPGLTHKYVGLLAASRITNLSLSGHREFKRLRIVLQPSVPRAMPPVHCNTRRRTIN
jgi:hypothetical protein